MTKTTPFTDNFAAPTAPRGIAAAAWVLLSILLVLLYGCAPARVATVDTIHITVEVDGKQLALQTSGGATAQSALQQASITLNTLDRVDPPGYTVLANNAVVKVTRVREAFTVEETTIPFDRQTVPNDSLTEGKTLLVQNGVNGKGEITYRQVFENDKEISKTVFKNEVVAEPVPQIMMVGVQKPFTPIPIPGKIVYMTAGNAWLMQTATNNRIPIVTTGDMDGRIFALSPKGDWLLFTRAEKAAPTPSATQKSTSSTATPAKINSLWAVDLTEEGSKPVNLKVDNVIHFAAWVPGKGLTITYSTVEPRATAPGWQANNDLQMLTFAPTGTVAKLEKILDTNMGGLYGWWGTNFAWSPDGSLLAYARPDQVGLIDLQKKAQVPLLDLVPFQTGSNWAWVPGISWAPNHNVLFLTTHPPKAGLESKESSPLFDLAGLPLGKQPPTSSGPLITIVPQAGMFTYPVAAPVIQTEDYKVAFLQAIFPEQSDKRYRLAVMDRDGSNLKVVFPSEDRPGLDPQRVAWSPATFDNGHLWLAVNYQGNIWLVDSETGDAQQLTADGLISRIDWK